MPSWKCVRDITLDLELIQALTIYIGSGHQSPGLWRHPEDESHRFNDVEHWTELAQLLESAKFHGIFIADVLGWQYLAYHNKRVLNRATIQEDTMSTKDHAISTLQLSPVHSGLSTSHWLWSRLWRL
jgi:alkanesulfonate monooxygenase SsuD/methylene tetrahydromethanopterin reductase-like flavin-dependent oxidoreductase (luciferase family)